MPAGGCSGHGRTTDEARARREARPPISSRALFLPGMTKLGTAFVAQRLAMTERHGSAVDDRAQIRHVNLYERLRCGVWKHVRSFHGEPSGSRTWRWQIPCAGQASDNTPRTQAHAHD